jgi:hypothetical protein
MRLVSGKKRDIGISHAARRFQFHKKCGKFDPHALKRSVLDFIQLIMLGRHWLCHILYFCGYLISGAAV